MKYKEKSKILKKVIAIKIKKETEEENYLKDKI